MGYYNVMERIRKTAGLSSLKGGYPDKDHRKCSDWASYIDAVETVTGELVSELVSCKESYAKLAGEKAAMAGKLANMHDTLAQADRKRMASEIGAKALAYDLPPEQQDALKEAVINS